jgi:hypothetical protein
MIFKYRTFKKNNTSYCHNNTFEKMYRLSRPVTGLEWPRGFQEVKVKHPRYRPGVAQRVRGS